MRGVGRLSQNPIDQIKQIETEATATISAATQQAAKIVAEAEKKAEQLYFDTIEAARSKTKQHLQEMRESGAAKREKDLGGLEDELDAMIANAKARQMEAIDKILALFAQ